MNCHGADLLLVAGDIDALAGLAPEQTLLSLLARDQQELVHASRRREDRLRRLLVRLLLALGVQELEGASIEATLRRIGKLESGQPVLAGSGWNVSFSHSGRMGACLLGRAERTGRVGVDVEQRRKIALCDVAVAFTPRECAYIETAGEADALLRLWTAKEAVLKLQGTGFLADPQGLEVLPPWRMASLPELFLQHVALPGNDDYTLAVAAEFPPTSFRTLMPSLHELWK